MYVISLYNIHTRNEHVSQLIIPRKITIFPLSTVYVPFKSLKLHLNKSQFLRAFRVLHLKTTTPSSLHTQPWNFSLYMCLPVSVSGQKSRTFPFPTLTLYNCAHPHPLLGISILPPPPDHQRQYYTYGAVLFAIQLCWRRRTGPSIWCGNSNANFVTPVPVCDIWMQNFVWRSFSE